MLVGLIEEEEEDDEDGAKSNGIQSFNILESPSSATLPSRGIIAIVDFIFRGFNIFILFCRELAWNKDAEEDDDERMFGLSFLTGFALFTISLLIPSMVRTPGERGSRGRFSATFEVLSSVV